MIDLKIPIVKVAMDHWTNAKRQEPEKAAKFANHPACLQVLHKLRMLQTACGRLDTPNKRFPVPLESFIMGIPAVKSTVLRNHFGDEIVDVYAGRGGEEAREKGGESLVGEIESGSESGVEIRTGSWGESEM